MGAKVRAFNWAATPLGSIATWTAAQRAVVDLVLSSAFPTCLFLGADLIAIYNDAYSPLTGNKPESLGEAYRVTWAEVWDELGPLTERVLAGESAFFEDRLLPLDRFGQLEDAWFTFSYSPVRDENGMVIGIMDVVVETTAKVKAERALRQETERLGQLFTQAPTFMALLRGPEHRFVLVNPGYSRLIAGRDAIGKTVAETLPEVVDQGFITLLDSVYASGNAFSATGVKVSLLVPDGGYADRYLDFVYQPIRDPDGTIGGIFVEGADVTVRHEAEAALRESEQRLRLLTELDEATRSLQASSDIMDVTTRMLGEYLKVSRCAYADIEDDEDHFTIRADYCAPGIETAAGYYSLDRFGSRAVRDLKDGRTLVLRDIATELTPDDGRDMFHSVAINAIVTCPLVKEGHLKALMAVHDTQAHNWSDAEIRLVEAVVQRCWAHIERIRSEEELRESERALRITTNALPQQVWTARPDGLLDYVNERTIEYSGNIEMSGGFYNWATIIHPDDLGNTSEAWSRSLESGDPYEVEQRIFHKASGTYRWHLSRALPLRNEAGEIVRWIGSNTDIEDTRQAQDAIIEARNAAEAANIAKSEFLANMSHEIRTPMNAVIGLSALLAKSTPLTQRQRDFIRTLQMSADSLLALINDLLDIAKIEARTIELEHIPFSMTRLVQEVASMMAVPVREKGLTFTGEGDCAENRMFMGDPTRLRQIVTNLCSNAIKFTSEGGIHVAITCHATDNADVQDVCISVRDTGIGIAADKIETIFDKFVQADSSINRKYGGTGLGLAITKTLVEIMGGTISVESSLGKGSVFTVCVPLELASEQPPELPVMRDLLETTIEGKARPLVLLVEDYEPNVVVAKSFLEDFGYRVDVARNGLEAFEKVKEGRHAAALMDVQMHGLNGLDATRMIRAHEAQQGRARLPIIGMTAHALAGDRERCLGVGMDDYIAKPFNPEELSDKLKELARP